MVLLDIGIICHQTLKRNIVLKSKSHRRSRWPRWCSATCRSRRSWPWWGWCRPAGPSQAGRREFSCQAASCQGERGGSCREARETGPSGAQLSGEGSGAVAWWAAARLWTECRPCQWGHCRHSRPASDEPTGLLQQIAECRNLFEGLIYFYRSRHLIKS